MSMISMQIDGLLRWADLYYGTTKPEMAKELQRPYLEQELREEADAIWQLRDALLDVEAENATMRQQLADVTESMGRVEERCAKLRELVDAWMGCGTRYHTMQGGCPMFDPDAEDFCKAASLARELGIEV